MRQKCLGFGGNLGYCLHPGNISPLFAELSFTTHVDLCSAILHFMPKNCLYFVYYDCSAHALTALATLPISLA